MKLSDLPFAILRFQYRLARTPLQMVEDRVLPLVDREAPGRLMYERAVGALDAAAGNALRDRALEENGISRIQRVAALGEAMRLDEVAEQKKEHAQDELARKREKAATAPQQARDDAAQRVASAREDTEHSAQNRSKAAEKAVTDVADHELDDAAAKRRAATGARARADRLEDLSDSERVRQGNSS